MPFFTEKASKSWKIVPILLLLTENKNLSIP
jgi:hypothetical protein